MDNAVDDVAMAIAAAFEDASVFQYVLDVPALVAPLEVLVTDESKLRTAINGLVKGLSLGIASGADGIVHHIYASRPEPAVKKV